jgi:hypothetical protein
LLRRTCIRRGAPGGMGRRRRVAPETDTHRLAEGSGLL